MFTLCNDPHSPVLKGGPDLAKLRHQYEMETKGVGKLRVFCDQIAKQGGQETSVQTSIGMSNLQVCDPFTATDACLRDRFLTGGAEACHIELIPAVPSGFQPKHCSLVTPSLEWRRRWMLLGVPGTQISKSLDIKEATSLKSIPQAWAKHQSWASHLEF